MPLMHDGRVTNRVPLQLLTDSRRGDLSRLGALLSLYRNYLGVLADSQLDKKLRRRISPSDIVQETMLEAHRDFPHFRGETEREFVAWLRRILLNTIGRAVESHVLTQKRDVRRVVSLNRLDAKAEGATQHARFACVARNESPSSGAQRRERASILADVMSSLTPDQREILMLRNMQGLKFREIGERMNRSVPATKMLWMRALKRVRELYEGRDEG